MMYSSELYFSFVEFCYDIKYLSLIYNICFILINTRLNDINNESIPSFITILSFNDTNANNPTGESTKFINL